MGNRDVMGGVFILLLTVFFIGVSVYWPGNPLTGRTVDENVCRGGICLEMCDSDDVCGTGQTCCETRWESGVCGFPSDCSVIWEQSEHQSIELYQDAMRERPGEVQGWSRFLFPLALVFLIILYFVLRRSDPHW